MTRERLPGLVLAAAAVAIALEATTFDVGFLTDPVGPKALPLLAAFLLGAAGVHAAARPSVSVRWPPGHVTARISAAVALLLVYPVALGGIGFFLATTLVVGSLSALYGARARSGYASAALLSAGLWLLFVRLLALPLPIGSLWIR